MTVVLNTAVPPERLLCAERGRQAIALRRARLGEPRVAALTAWVNTVRDRLDECHAKTVCDFDPDGGGVEARVMYLAQDPSSTAAWTGFISPDNNDMTAKATTEACAKAGLAALERVHWNVYPWWRDAPCSTRVPRANEHGRVTLLELFVILREIRSVVLIGGEAERAWKSLFRTAPPKPELSIWCAPHPSHGWWTKPYKPGIDGRPGRVVAVSALRAARDHAYT